MLRIDKLYWERNGAQGLIVWFNGTTGKRSLWVQTAGQKQILISLNDGDTFHTSDPDPKQFGFCAQNCTIRIDPGSSVNFDLRTNVGNLLWGGGDRIAIIGFNTVMNQPESYTLSGEPILPVTPDAVSVCRWAIGVDEPDGSFSALFTRG